MNDGGSRRTTREHCKLSALERVWGNSLGKKLPSELDWGRIGEFQKGSGHLARPESLPHERMWSGRKRPCSSSSWALRQEKTFGISDRAGTRVAYTRGRSAAHCFNQTARLTGRSPVLVTGSAGFPGLPVGRARGLVWWAPCFRESRDKGGSHGVTGVLSCLLLLLTLPLHPALRRPATLGRSRL